MAEQDKGNGAAVPTPAAAGTVSQQLIINAQYIKDLSFENPRAPQSLMQQTVPPSVEINVDVKAQGVGGDAYEVVLTINASAKAAEDTLFLLELSYGAVVTAQNAPPDILPTLILVETPRLMFPFARNIVAEATRDGGFPPLLINPIDFADLLRRNSATPPPPGDTAAV